MENDNKNEHAPEDSGSRRKEYKRYAAKRIVAGTLITVLVIWMASLFFGFFEDKSQLPKEHAATAQSTATVGHAATGEAPSVHLPAVAGDRDLGRYKNLFERKMGEPESHPAGDSAPVAGHEASAPAPSAKGHPPAAGEKEHAAAITAAGGAAHGPTPAGEHAPAPTEPQVTAKSEAAATHAESVADASSAPAPEKTEAAEAGHGAAPAPAVKRAPGVAFVEAVIKPLDHELNERFWGWRSNDIINVTDNVNNFQLGVLEVTRRTSIVLTERISRIGSAAAFDKNMEQAMNWFMIQPSRYWLPSPEDKYNEGLDNLRRYAEKLERGEARFYTRTDNLIPLLAVYQDLLGSCDENLVKAKEDNGKDVSSFDADDYFFYARGVANAMMGILEAVIHDFDAVLESRKAREALHHAVETLHHATEISPWIILNSDLSSIFANHRANMAAPISHARFYLSVAIGALST